MAASSTCKLDVEGAETYLRAGTSQEGDRMEPNNLMDLGGGVGWIGTLIIGALAGWIAEKVMKANHGLLMNIIIGIIGSYVGAFIANALGIRLGEIFQGWFVGNLIVAAAGAIVLLWVVRLVRSR
jgi:uncharacterized membrane protein YeaQ/YmgE (transglycosylase-associated protein family)